MTVRILQGDCRTVMATLPEASVDAVVCDPPYELAFMGKKWDGTGVAFDPETWRQALRVLKPGGHLLAFGGTRTYHRMVCAIEDAGFEIRDQIGWLYGSGFPKSLDVSKAIDKAAGAEREIVGVRQLSGYGKANVVNGQQQRFTTEFPKTSAEAATDASRQWQGWGTALKPAWEPICMARKPLIGTVAVNVLAHGTGALNIDGCRVDAGERPLLQSDRRPGANGTFGDGLGGSKAVGETTLGRWPANIIHDGSDEVLAAFPWTKDGAAVNDAKPGKLAYHGVGGLSHAGFGSEGSAARFFKECKWDQHESTAPTAASTFSLSNALAASVASAAAIWPCLAGVLAESSQEPSTSVTESESRATCECAITAMTHIACGFSLVSLQERRTQSGSHVTVAAQRERTGITTITASLLRSDGSAEVATFTITPSRLDRGELGFVSRLHYTAKASRHDRNDGLQRVSGNDRSHHPTVKPTDLMRYLCRLVTPPGGTVLDPFMGSGSTLKAAELEGFAAIGIELDPAYIDIARRRIASDAPLFAEVET